VFIGLGLAIVLLVTFIGGTVWLLNRQGSSEASGTDSGEAVSSEQSDEFKEKLFKNTPSVEDSAKPEWTEKDPVSVIFIGIDAREFDVGRADTIIVVTIDPVKKAAMLVSIPRDVVSLVPGYENLRINELFGYGGPELVRKSAEILLGIPIQYYVTIDFDGFKHIIDELGGVEIDVKYDINDYRFPNRDDTGFDPFIIKSGIHHMDGDTLLRYVRTRFDDPRGDFGRIDRQQQALVALKTQLLTFQSLAKATLLISDLSGLVDTDFPIVTSPQKAIALGWVGMDISRERIYSFVVDYEGDLVKDDELSTGAKVLRPNLAAVRSKMQESLAAMGELQQVAGQEATLQQADVEP
jgi:LCP family protein required for cell wall assembly